MSPQTTSLPDNQFSDQNRLEAILNEISARLVLPAPDPHSPGGQSAAARSTYIQIIAFRLGDLRFGLDVLSIDEVIRSSRLTRVPGAPGWLKGVISFHGEIISVVDLGRFLGIAERLPVREMVILVAHAGTQRIGLAVDRIDTIYTTPDDQIASPSFTIDPAVVPYLRGAVEHRGEFIRLLHGERLLLGQQMQQFS